MGALLSWCSAMSITECTTSERLHMHWMRELAKQWFPPGFSMPGVVISCPAPAGVVAPGSDSPCSKARHVDTTQHVRTLACIHVHMPARRHGSKCSPFLR